MSYHTFTSAGSLPDRFRTKGRYSMLMLGAEGSDTLGTSLKIQRVTATGGLHTIREITSLASLTNNSLKLELPPGSTIDITVAGSPTLYVELADLTG